MLRDAKGLPGGRYLTVSEEKRMGVPVDHIISLTFALGAAVAAVGGTLYGMAYTIDPYMGIRIGWWAFISAVVGGIGSVRGAMIGGFILGFVEIFTPVILPASTYRDLVAFSPLLLLLIFRPTGILGRTKKCTWVDSRSPGPAEGCGADQHRRRLQSRRIVPHH